MYEISKDGIPLGSVVLIGTGAIVRNASGAPLGQVAGLAAAIALLMRARAS